MESYIDCKKKLYEDILEFLEESGEVSQAIFKKFCENMRNLSIEGDQEEMTQFLLIIKSISDHHRRDCNFIQRIKDILHHFKEQIKQTLSNEEIFHIFESNKLIVLFLLTDDIISISESIFNDMIDKIESNGNRYCHFFYTELEKFKGEEEMKYIKEELLTQNPTAFEQYESKRQEGENDSHICSLIRNDSIDEFIIYINRHNISVSSQITPSIFETNSFLIDNKTTTFIEYSAFFGSIQIFQFLLMNNVELTPSLWLYSIHSKNAELIHLLESNQINQPKFTSDNSNEKQSYLKCFIESIKCHHKDIAEYIKSNLIQEQEFESNKTQKEVLSNIMKYHNYSYFQTDIIKEQGFFDCCYYNYQRLFDFLLKEKKGKIQKRIIFNRNILIKR